MSHIMNRVLKNTEINLDIILDCNFSDRYNTYFSDFFECGSYTRYRTRVFLFFSTFVADCRYRKKYFGVLQGSVA